MSTPIFSLTDIHFEYLNGPKVLDGLNFSLHAHERIGIIGPNGTGKTTMAHILMGLVKPSRGRIHFHGEPVSAERDFLPLRQSIGLLFQNAEDQLIYPTVLEDVAFGPLNMGKSSQEAKEIALRVLSELGLEGFDNRITHRLSGGEKKLVSLAAVLAMDPEALFLDEPTNALDAKTRAHLVEILNSLNKALVIISHDWDFLAQTTESIYSMKDGKITLDGDTHTHQHVHAHSHGSTPHVHGDS